MTTLYFEVSDEDDLRKTGFSTEGKPQNPQIFIGLLVGLGGYAIGYDIFEGNIYEGHTLIQFIEKISSKFNLNKTIVVADSELLSNYNIKALVDQKYEYILGAKLKNEPEKIKKQNANLFSARRFSISTADFQSRFKSSQSNYMFRGAASTNAALFL